MMPALSPFSSLIASASKRVSGPAAAPRVQERPALNSYSRIDRARFPFAVAIANLGAASRRTSLENLAGSPSGFPAPFGQFLSLSVGALFARIFNVSPSRTYRTSSPRATNREVSP